MATALSLNEFRARVDDIIDTVVNGEEAVVVTLADGRKFVLILSDEWQSMVETSYHSSTANNRAALVQSLHEALEGHTVEVELKNFELSGILPSRSKKNSRPTIFVCVAFRARSSSVPRAGHLLTQRGN